MMSKTLLKTPHSLVVHWVSNVVFSLTVLALLGCSRFCWRLVALRCSICVCDNLISWAFYARHILCCTILVLVVHIYSLLISILYVLAARQVILEQNDCLKKMMDDGLQKMDDYYKEQCFFECPDSTCWCPVWCLPMSMWTRTCQKHRKFGQTSDGCWSDINVQKNRVSGYTESVPYISQWSATLAREAK